MEWPETPLGPPSLWPERMRGVVDAALLSPYPVLTLWGERDLMVFNEAFAALGRDLDALQGRPFPRGGLALVGLDEDLLDRARHGRGCALGAAAVRDRDGAAAPAAYDLRVAPVAFDPAMPAGLYCVATPSKGEAAGREGAGRENAEHEAAHDRHQALLLSLADRFRGTEDPEDILAAALSTLGQELEADRVRFGEVDASRHEAALSPGWTAGDPATRSVIPLDDLVDGQATRLQNGEAVVTGAGANSSMSLAVPILRDSRLRAVIVAERADTAPWRPTDVALVEDVATRTWDALDRARGAAILRRNQARQGFLLVLGDRLRELEDTKEIAATVEESLGRHLKLGRASYGEVVGDEIVFATGWFDGSAAPAVSRFALEALGPHRGADLSRGLTVTFAAIPGEEPTPLLEGLSTLAAVPLLRDGRLRGALVLGHKVDHAWSPDEIALAAEVAARLWEALERARAEAALYDLNATLETRVVERTEALRASETRFRTLFENAPAPIFLIEVGPGRRAVFEGFNAAAQRFFGPLAGDSRGHAVSGRTSAGENMLDVCLRCAALDQPLLYEVTVADEAGARTADCVLAPLEIAGGSAKILIGIARDITAQREAEEQLRQAQKMEAIGQLTGGIAHDFNNLLTGIIGSLALMEKRLAQGRTDVVARYAELAMQSANRAAALTHRLLAFSRRQPLQAKAVDVNELVSEMDDLLRRTIGEAIALYTVVAEDVWLTLCDPHQLENAVLNLAINARDAMPDGGCLTIETTNVAVDAVAAAREPDLEAGEYVAVTVTDTGTGMPPDIIARVFDPFFTTKPIGQGTGLGLSMIYGFAKQSEGHISIDSEVGRGTAVRILLPRFRGRSTAPRRETGADQPRRGAGETVLVVEDDATVRNLVLETLEELGYQAIQAADGPAGVEVLQSPRRVDLLVTDVGLPGMNGRQVADLGRLHRPTLKVLFITGYAENAAFGSGHLEAGMGMMTKPFTVDELASRLRSILEPTSGLVGKH